MHVSYLVMFMELYVTSACEISFLVAFLARKVQHFPSTLLTASVRSLQLSILSVFFHAVPLHCAILFLLSSEILKASVHFIFYRTQ